MRQGPWQTYYVKCPRPDTPGASMAPKATKALALMWGHPHSHCAKGPRPDAAQAPMTPKTGGP